MTSMQVNGGPYGVKLFCPECRDEYEVRTPKGHNEVVNRILKFADDHRNCLDFRKALEQSQEDKEKV